MQWGLLAPLNDLQREELFRAARRRTFTRNAIVFHEGDAGDTLHLVESGRFAVRITTPLGETATIRIHGAGSYFGELAVVDPAPRSATVTALEAGATLALHRESFERWRRDHPGIDALLVDALTQEVRRLSGRLVEAMYMPAPQRMVRCLLDLSEEYADGAGGATVPLTQEDLAGLCGTTRSTANQILSRLADRGLVTMGRGRITVADVEALRLA